MMRRAAFYSFILSVLIGVLVLFSGCAGGQGGNSNTMTIDEQSNGKTVNLKQGQELAVRLESNPTTGYSWEIAENDAALLKPQGEPEYQDSNQGVKRAGAGGWQVFHFTGEKAGQTSLKLIYHRPWEKDVAPIQTFQLQVTVQ